MRVIRYKMNEGNRICLILSENDVNVRLCVMDAPVYIIDLNPSESKYFTDIMDSDGSPYPVAGALEKIMSMLSWCEMTKRITIDEIEEIWRGINK